MKQHHLNSTHRLLTALVVALLFGAVATVTVTASHLTTGESTQSTVLDSVQDLSLSLTPASDLQPQSQLFLAPHPLKNLGPLGLLEMCTPAQWQQCAPGTLTCLVENRRVILCDGEPPAC
ncbi:MAG: hypothetical protein K0U98_10875 [Deltaproteobacteria bacterium]|nr:hypothetical protein [Deltaproteobacteria bacterium]